MYTKMDNYLSSYTINWNIAAVGSRKNESKFMPDKQLNLLRVCGNMPGFSF